MRRWGERVKGESGRIRGVGKVIEKGGRKGVNNWGGKRGEVNKKVDKLTRREKDACPAPSGFIQPLEIYYTMFHETIM